MSPDIALNHSQRGWTCTFTRVFVIALSVTFVATAAAQEPPNRPNVILIFADDLGYGDLSCYGHPTIRTPHLDRMAAEGLRFTQFYSAGIACTPSRAALMTGRHAVRSGLSEESPRVLFPDSGGGLPESELTIAELLKQANYDTACVGKWHLGHLPQFLPTNQGFDRYLGLPYSNDMDRVPTSPKGLQAFLDPRSDYWNVPLMRDTKIVERPADQTTLTKRYAEEAVGFINEHKLGDKPFLLYLAHTMPHVPLFRSREFENVSRRGLYGDVVEEVDWSVGQVLDTLRETGLAENTLVWFTSDNGPWIVKGLQGGSAGLLRDGKGSTFEGGVREPGIAWWPGTVKPGVTTELGSTLDILPTACAMAGVELPKDRKYDGYDLSSLLKNGEASPRHEMFYYRGQDVFAVRQGPWKAHFTTQIGYGGQPEKHDPPVLYNVELDPSETTNMAKDHPDIIARLTDLAEQQKKTIEKVPSQLAIKLPE
ncbi:MAG: sulfatase [Planctomycetota bacterium]|nr:sulfatase [Planctomycetota bacterium]